MRTLLLTSFAALLALVPPALAAPPDATTIAKDMKAALEPDHSSTRTLVVKVHSQGETVQWTARQARKTVAKHKRILTVLEEPADVRGMAVVVEEQKNQDSDLQWAYYPPIRRVRKIFGFMAMESFLGTDFSYEQMGFIDLRDRTFTFLGEDTLDKTPCYKIQEVANRNFYYSRIVTWVAKDSMLPLQREYYDVLRNLWKKETFGDVQKVQGIATPLYLRMEDVQAKTSTEIQMSQVRYDVKLPDSLFQSELLPEVLKHPF